MKNIKNKLMIFSSTTLAILVMSSLSVNTTGQLVKEVNYQSQQLRTLPVKTTNTQIGAFANLDSFDHDGFNGGVKAAASAYNNGDWASVNQQTSLYSSDGAIYVDLLNELFNKSDIIISAGFQVANAVTGLPGQFDGVFTDRDGHDTSFANSKDKSFVLLDDTSLGNRYSNAASVSYAAEGAGFLAGLGGAIYTEYDAYVNKKETANIVMWGGMPFDTVVSFLAGFAQAISWTNETYASVSNFKPITLWSGGQRPTEKIKESNSYGTITDANTWFTTGFESSSLTPDGKSAKIKTQNAIDAGASIVFPVAGGNTTIAEATLASQKSSTKLIGVDADVTLTSDHDELYIGTAAKNLVDGGQLALWSMDDDDDDGLRNYEDSDSVKSDEYNNWLNTSTNDKGVELQGSIENGGVSFIYDEGQDSGINNDFQTAIMTIFGKNDPAEAKVAFEEFLDNATLAQGGVINSADTQFNPKPSNDETHYWVLWIILVITFLFTLLGYIISIFKKSLTRKE